MVIVNPVAGRGRAMRSVGWLRERLLSRPEARVEVTGRFGEAEALSAGAAARGHDRVIAAGGDGTVQEVVNGLLSVADPPLRVSLHHRLGVRGGSGDQRSPRAAKRRRGV
ncbi:MAG: acylglycerol kinase family protein [Chloroflexi bacterium]|nr:acylglycerol kinase family protein [Chloroflexota bacterium]